MNKYWHDLKMIVVVFFLMVSSVAITLWIVREVEVFSPPQSRVSADGAPAGPAQFMSTMELQRELNRLYPKLKLKVDGVYGPRTQEAHERAVGDQYAKELMAWEVR